MKTFLIQNEIDNEFIRLKDIKKGRPNICYINVLKSYTRPNTNRPKFGSFESESP